MISAGTRKIRERAVVSTGEGASREILQGSIAAGIREAENGSAGAFIPSVMAQRSTGNERLRASNQEPPGHHVTRDTPMGCYCTALSKT